MRSPHEHAFLELRCASVSELAAKEVKRSVVIRVTSCEDLHLVSMWCASHHLLSSCNAYDVVVNIWVLVPCEAGAPCRRTIEKLSVESGSLGMTCKLEVAAVGLFRHDVRICDQFCLVWSNGSDTWKCVNVRNLFAWCGSFSCLVSKAVNSEGGVFCVKMVKTFGRVAGAARIHVFHHSMLVAFDNADGNRFNASVQQPYANAIHGDSSQHVAEEASLQLAGNAADGKFSKKLYVYDDAWRNISMDPIENNYLTVSDETHLESPGDHLDSGLIMPRVRLLLHGLSDRNVLKHCWCYFPKMQTDDAMFFKQFVLYTALPGHVRLHPASANLTVIPDAPVRQSMKCNVLPFLPCIEPNAPRVAFEVFGRVSIAQDTLRKNTDFLRRIMAPMSGVVGVTLSYVCPHCSCFPLDAYMRWVSSEHGDRSNRKEKQCSWWCGACGGQHDWKAPRRLLVAHFSANTNLSEGVQSARNICDNVINAFKLSANQQKDGDSPIKCIVTCLHWKSRRGIMDGLESFIDAGNRSAVDVGGLRRGTLLPRSSHQRRCGRAKVARGRGGCAASLHRHEVH